MWVVAAEKREGGILCKGIELAFSTDRKERFDRRSCLNFGQLRDSSLTTARAWAIVNDLKMLLVS